MYPLAYRAHGSARISHKPAAWQESRWRIASAALEAKVGGKSIEAQFREQAELIDRRFDDEFRQQAELIDKLFAYRFEHLDKKLNPRFGAMERALGVVQGDVNMLKSDVSALQKDMVIVREGISILLKRRPQ